MGRMDTFLFLSPPPQWLYKLSWLVYNTPKLILYVVILRWQKVHLHSLLLAVWVFFFPSSFKWVCSTAVKAEVSDNFLRSYPLRDVFEEHRSDVGAQFYFSWLYKLPLKTIPSEESKTVPQSMKRISYFHWPYMDDKGNRMWLKWHS